MQLDILISLLTTSVKKNGKKTVVTLEHLLFLCEFAKKFEKKLIQIDELKHQELLNTISNMGQS